MPKSIYMLSTINQIIYNNVDNRNYNLLAEITSAENKIISPQISMIITLGSKIITLGILGSLLS